MTDSVSLYNKILSFINNEYDSIIPNNNNISNNDISYDKANDKTLMNKANDDITNDTPGSTEVLENLIHMDTDNVNGGIAMETLTENLVGGNNVNNTSDNIISSYNSNDTSIGSSSHNATKANDKQKTLSNTDITKEIYETNIKQFDTNLLEGGDGTKHSKDTKSDTKASDHNTSNDKHKDNDKNKETQDDKHKDKDKSKESSSDSSSDDESKDDQMKNITININNTGTENINEESSSSSSSDEEEEIIQEPINNNKDISHIPTDTTKASDHNTSNDKHNTSKTNDTKANDDKKDTSSRDTTKTSDHNTNNDKTNDEKKDTKHDDKNKINKANDTSISSYNNDDDNIGDITILNVGQPGDDNDINSIIFGSDSEDTEYDCSNSSNSSCDEYSDDEGEVSKFAMFLKKFQNKDHIDYEDNTTVTGGNNTQELEVLTMFPYLVR